MVSTLVLTLLGDVEGWAYTVVRRPVLRVFDAILITLQNLHEVLNAANAD